MGGVTIHTGPIDERATIDEVPPDRWPALVRAWRLFVHTRAYGDCRLLVSIMEQAQAIYRRLGYASVDDFVGQGLNASPDVVRWAVEGLAMLDPSEPIPVLRAVEASPLRAQQFAEAAKPLAQHGGARTEQGNQITLLRRGTDPSYLTARIARDAPDVLEAMKRGEYRSVRAAARAAGIVREPTLYERAERLCSRLTPDERARLKAWL